jgi:hypothetical protein
VSRAWRYEELGQLTKEELTARSDTLVEKVKPLFAGIHPAVQGLALANLLAIWLAGYDAEIAEKLLAEHVDGVRALVSLIRETPC